MTFPMNIYFEKLSFYEINRNTSWAVTDKIIKWFQWVVFIAY